MIYRLIYSVIFFSLIYSNINHLVFSRVTIRPNQAELISIYNPASEEPLDLSNYYITDSNLYYNLPSGTGFWSESIFDFIVRFPDGYSIQSGESIIIGISDNFSDHYEYNPDLTLDDMRDAVDGESTAGLVAGLHDNNEMLMLFKWSGNPTEKVQDVDYFIWGNANEGVDKTGIGEYFPDTPILEQTPFEANQDNYTYTRITLDSEGDEILSDGNGITGHDETSENLPETWQSILSPDVSFGCTDLEACNYDSDAIINDNSCIYETDCTGLCNEVCGCMNSSAPNYNPDATVDNNTCIDLTIEDIYSQYESDITAPCNEDLSVNISTMGLIANYQNKVPSGGPRIITIQDSEGYQIDAVIWDWDPEESEIISEYIDPYNPTQYYVFINGALGVYNCNFQLEISSESGITYLSELHPEGEYQEDESILKSKVDVAPYVLVPTSGERIDFSYSFPSGSRVIVRIFDISGRLITSLVDRYFENSGTVYRQEDGSDWDGRDHLGQVVSPGTYIIHIEAMNFQTGVTTSDMAPIVVGVRP